VVVEFKALLMRTMTFLHGRPLEPLLVAYAWWLLGSLVKSACCWRTTYIVAVIYHV
jgi:hypothetical protein